jgi:hypothetical protein
MKLIGTDQNGHVQTTSLTERNNSGCEVVVELEDSVEVYPDCTSLSGTSVSINDQEEFDKQRAAKWDEIRLIRNNVIATTDWTQLGDVELTTEQVTAWQTYRTQLRDMIDEDTNPFAVVWPTEPS